MWHALWHMKLRGGNFHAATTSQDMLYWKYGCKRNITLLPSSSNILWLYNSVTGGSFSWFRSQYWWISSKVKMWEREWRRNEKLFHYVLSIHNTRKIQFGNRVSDEICRISKQKGAGGRIWRKKKKKLQWPSITDLWSGREENVKFLHLLVMYLQRQNILLRGNFKESDICYRANTVKHGSLKSP